MLRFFTACVSGIRAKAAEHWWERLGEKEGAREGGASKGAFTKKGRKESCLVKIVEERQRLHIKRRLHVNCSGNSFEELFSFLNKKGKEKGREPPFIFSCKGFFKLLIKSLRSSFQKIKVLNSHLYLSARFFKLKY